MSHRSVKSLNVFIPHPSPSQFHFTFHDDLPTVNPIFFLSLEKVLLISNLWIDRSSYKKQIHVYQKHLPEIVFEKKTLCSKFTLNRQKQWSSIQ